MKIKILLLLFFLNFIIIVNGQNNSEAKKTSKKNYTPLKAAVLSAIIPGGGQIYNKKYIKAIAVSSLELSFISLYFYHKNKADDYLDQSYSTSDTYLQDKYYNKYKTMFDKSGSDLWWLGTSIFLSTIDAYVDAHLSNFEQKKRQLHLEINPKRIALYYNF